MIVSRHFGDVHVFYMPFAPARCFEDSRVGTKERKELEQFSAANRRQSYLAGRWLGKRLIAEKIFGVASTTIEILSRDSTGRSTRPMVFVSGNEMQNVRLSISHSSTGVLVAATGRDDCNIGCDLESPSALGFGFQQMWFSDSERKWLRGGNEQQAATIWAAKEAAYKAINKNETFAPRRFEVEANESNSWNCEYRRENRNQNCRIQLMPFTNEIAVLARC